MASISKNRKTGYRRVLFEGKDGKRKTIRLGKVPLRFAQEVKAKVEAVILAGDALDAETAAWLARVSDTLHARLAAVGLIPARKMANPGIAALGQFIDAHIAKRKQAGTKANTLMNLEAGKRFLVGCFGADRDLRTITPNDADEFKLWMQGKGYAQATIGRQIKHAKYYFRVAVRSKVIEDNPFTDVKPPSQANEERKFFVTLEAAYEVLDRGLRAGGAGGVARYQSIPRRRKEFPHPPEPHHPAGWVEALAQAFPQSPGQPGNGACR